MKKMHGVKLHIGEMHIPRWTCGVTRDDIIRNWFTTEKSRVAPIEVKIKECCLRRFKHLHKRLKAFLIPILLTKMLC